MIHEIAIEPDLVATWHDPREARFFVAQIGLGQPRVACRFPSKEWERLVMQALDQLGLEPVALQGARKRLETLLRHLSEHGTQRDGTLPLQETWLDSATKEHRRRPFHAILVQRAPIKASYLLDGETLRHDTPGWHFDPGPVRRDGVELAKALAPMLRCATQIRIVDTYFDAAEERFRQPFAQMLQHIGERAVRIEIHTTPGGGREERTPDRTLAEQKARDAVSHLGPLLPPKTELTFFVWAEQDERGRRVPAGEQLHNRYVLTNVGGVAVQAGVDRCREHDTSATDDVTVLSAAQFKARWAQYARGSRSMHEVVPPTTIPSATSRPRR
jgi:hypothetical protein